MHCHQRPRRRAERLLRPGGLRVRRRDGTLRDRRPPPPRSGRDGVHEPLDQLLPPARARVRGAGHRDLRPGNRSAAIRIPKYANRPESARFEFRPPDATANPYLALAAQLLAGLDGVEKKMDPTALGFGPVDGDVAALPPSGGRRSVPSRRRSTSRSTRSRRDNAFLTRDGVFPGDLFPRWIRKKREEDREVRNRPHPSRIGRILLRPLTRTGSSGRGEVRCESSAVGALVLSLAVPAHARRARVFRGHGLGRARAEGVRRPRGAGRSGCKHAHRRRRRARTEASPVFAIVGAQNQYASIKVAVSKLVQMLDPAQGLGDGHPRPAGEPGVLRAEGPARQPRGRQEHEPLLSRARPTARRPNGRRF